MISRQIVCERTKLHINNAVEVKVVMLGINGVGPYCQSSVGLLSVDCQLTHSEAANGERPHGLLSRSLSQWLDIHTTGGWPNGYRKPTSARPLRTSKNTNGQGALRLPVLFFIFQKLSIT